jgi:N-methylhydantoinase B
VTKSNIVYRGSGVRAGFEDGRSPIAPSEVDPDRVEVLPAKSRATLGEDDLRVCVVAGGGGFGDPLRREPEAVLRDVAENLISPALARSVYGIAIVAGGVDADATATARERIRAERLASARPIDGAERIGEVAGGELLHPVTDTVEAVATAAGAVLRCGQCGEGLGDLGADFKRAAHLRELPITEQGELNSHGLVDEIVLRQFVCPGCGTALVMDVQLAVEPILDECRFFGAGADDGDAS